MRADSIGEDRMQHEIRRMADPAGVARAGAAFVAERARRAISSTGRFCFAASGGRTPWAMLAELAGSDVSWDQVVMYQVDERVAHEGDPERNLTHLRQALAGLPVQIVAMPVELPDLDAAIASYEALLP